MLDNESTPTGTIAVATMEPASVVASSSTVIVPTEGSNLELAAQSPDEMRQCQEALILWTKRKIELVEAEYAELRGAYKHAVERKWKASVLKRHADLAAKRIVFYQKMKAALEAGYYIVPNFPVTLFAIRTDRKKPARMYRVAAYAPRMSQNARILPQGEGQYQNPEPITMQSKDARKDLTGRDVRDYWNKAWDDMEFPANMAKLEVMRAATRAMGLKIFDELGMLPADRVRHTDPILIGCIIDPRGTYYHNKLSFMIAWHLDTRTL